MEKEGIAYFKILQNMYDSCNNVVEEEPLLKKHKKSTTISEWNSTNTGRPFSFISAMHALRTTETATSDVEEGEVCDLESDIGQSSDLYSID